VPSQNKERSHMNSLYPVRGVVCAAILTCTSWASAFAADVNVYTTREPGLIQPVLDSFNKKTGLTTNVISVKEGLAERVKAEGRNSPADVLITVDFGNLKDAVDAGVTQKLTSAKLSEAVPANLHGANGEWYALTTRARVIYVSKDRVKDEKFTYEDLADPKWKGKICIRSGQHPYNTALIAAMIAKHGEEKTENWLKGVKANLGRTATGGDRDVAKDILAGICDIGVGNSYYVGLMRNSADASQKKWGEAIRVVLPTFDDGKGTHVNISGAALAKNAPHRDNAIKLLEFMVSPEGQEVYSNSNFEYPVVSEVPIETTIASLGNLKTDPLALEEIASHRKQASLLVDKVGFDD
jgi:iron(III) transport system substrate-binding protein